MRVVQVNYRFDEGLGDPDALLEQYSTLTGWSTALLDAGAERVTVVQRFHREATVSREGVEYVFCADDPKMPWRGLARSPARTHRAVVQAHPDIVHVNGLDSPLWTSALRRTLPASSRVIVQDHGSQVPGPRGGPVERYLRHGLRVRAMRVPDAFFFTAREQADPWRAAGLIGAHQGVYEVLEASTRLRPMNRIEARRMSGVHGSPALLWVGRLDANKDPLTMLDGFERTIAELPLGRLTMVYTTEDLLGAVRARVEASAVLASRVRFAARVPHRLMAAFFSAADIFVLASHREGSGYALIEACACGAVPVVTRIPTFRRITAEGAIGALWTPGDPAACAQALVEVATGMLNPARARSLEHFDRALNWSEVGRQAMAAYRDVVSRVRQPSRAALQR